MKQARVVSLEMLILYDMKLFTCIIQKLYNGHKINANIITGTGIKVDDAGGGQVASVLRDESSSERRRQHAGDGLRREYKHLHCLGLRAQSEERQTHKGH